MKSLFLLAAVPILMLLVPNVSATTDNFRDAFRNISEEEREIWFSEKERPAINPDFDPDFDCNIAYEIKCIPGSQQSCFDLEGYNNHENNVCTPIKCQEGYHSEYDDETGLCYPNEEGCYNDTMVLIEREGEDDAKFGDTCVFLVDICDEAEHRGEDYCIE